MPTNLHSLLKDEISPISTDDEFSRTGKSSLDNSTTMKTSVNLAAFEGFFSFFNTMRQTDNFLNPLRCRPCSLLQGWPPSAGGFDIPKGTTEDLVYDIHPTVVYITYGSKIQVFTTPFIKAWDVIAARSHFLGSILDPPLPAGHHRADQ